MAQTDITAIPPFKFSKFSLKQLKLLYFFWDFSPYKDAPIVIADGAVRSGKTVACICSFLIWSQSKFTNRSFIIAGVTYRSLTLNVVSPLLQIVKAWGWSCSYSESSHSILIGSNTYLLYEAHNLVSQDKLQGLTAAGALADEVALFPRNFVDQLIARCSVHGSKIFFNCNPSYPTHFFKTNFIDNAKQKDYFYLHFTLDDNLSLSDQIKTRLKNSFSGNFYSRYIEGLWTAADGLIFPYFASDMKPFFMPISDFSKSQFSKCYVGVDFGGSKSATAFVATAFAPDFSHTFIIKSKRIPDLLSPDTLNSLFLDFMLSISDFAPFFDVFCDNAEPILIRGLKSYMRFRMPNVSIKNAVKSPILNRIRLTDYLLSKRLISFSEASTSLTDALAFSRWASDSCKDLRLDDGSSDIDSLDAFEYTIERFSAKLIAGDA